MIKCEDNVYKLCDRDDLPDGEYQGLMSGYNVKFNINGSERFTKSIGSGVRGIDVPVTVTIKDGCVTAVFKNYASG